MEGTFTETLGQYLKREREARSVSLEELSRGSRIGRPYLEALEQNNFLFFSKREYILGFLRGYARHLGLNPEEVLKRYHIQSELTSRKESYQQLSLFSTPAPPPPEIPEPAKVSKSFLPPKEKRSSRRIIFLQLTVVLATAGLTLYLQHLLGQTEDSKKSPLVESTLSLEAKARGANQNGVISNSQRREKIGSLPQESRDNQKKAKVMGDRKLKIYSLPGMKDYDKVESARRMEFNSEEEAVKAGYRKASQRDGKN
jgi:cytoskeletal protein RodZ